MKLAALLIFAVFTIANVKGQVLRRRPRPPPIRMPSRVEMTVAINDPDTIDKALACIEGLPCKLDQDYAVMLRRFGPELMMRGHCPRRLCTQEQAEEAKWLMTQIHRKYPKKYMSTVNRLVTRNAYRWG